MAVTASPQAGKVNKAVKELFAEFLQIEKTAVEIVDGRRSSRKLIEFNVSDERKISGLLNQYSGVGIVL